jgi:hypothetical protein
MVSSFHQRWRHIDLIDPREISIYWIGFGFCLIWWSLICLFCLISHSYLHCIVWFLRFSRLTLGMSLGVARLILSMYFRSLLSLIGWLGMWLRVGLSVCFIDLSTSVAHFDPTVWVCDLGLPMIDLSMLYIFSACLFLCRIFWFR